MGEEDRGEERGVEKKSKEKIFLSRISFIPQRLLLVLLPMSP